MNIEHLIQDKGELLLEDDPRRFFDRGKPDYDLMAQTLVHDEEVYSGLPRELSLYRQKQYIKKALRKRHWKHIQIRDSHLYISRAEKMKLKMETK